MNALIPVFAGEIAGGSAQLVDARALHGFLEVGKDFSTWIKLRIRHYRFQLNHDYLEIFAHQNGGAKTGSGGHNAIEYHLTLDMAKELAMVERNDKGHEARRYFIECERRLMQSPSAPHAIPLLLTGDTQAQAGKRYLVTFGGDGQTYAAWPLEPDCWVMTPDQLVKNLHEFPLDADTLAALIASCAQRLKTRALPSTPRQVLAPYVNDIDLKQQVINAVRDAGPQGINMRELRRLVRKFGRQPAEDRRQFLQDLMDAGVIMATGLQKGARFSLLA